MNADTQTLAAHGWHLLDTRPPWDVGSWLIIHNGEAALLELAPGQTSPVQTIRETLAANSATLRYILVSHTHEDHFDPTLLARIQKRPFASDAIFLDPVPMLRADIRLQLGGEPLWRIHAPKHSPDDAVTIFRGVAMTGDIELGQLESCNDEISPRQKLLSLDYYAQFPQRTPYTVHTTVSAHLNDYRTSINWPQLFTPTDIAP